MGPSVFRRFQKSPSDLTQFHSPFHCIRPVQKPRQIISSSKNFRIQCGYGAHIHRILCLNRLFQEQPWILPRILQTVLIGKQKTFQYLHRLSVLPLIRPEMDSFRLPFSVQKLLIQKAHRLIRIIHIQILCVDIPYGILPDAVLRKQLDSEISVFR